MKIFKQTGSKERFLEMFQSVNKIKLNEAFGQGLNPQSVLNVAFEELKNDTLTIKHSNTQIKDNESYVELSGVDKEGNNATFVFKAIVEEGDQEGVFNIKNVTLDNFAFDSNGEESVELSGDALKQFNYQYANEMLDIVNKLDVKEEEPVESDELYEDAVRKIDSVPFRGGSERMVKHSEYADEKPTNPDIRVTDAEELKKFIQEGDMNTSFMYALVKELRKLTIEPLDTIDTNSSVVFKLKYNGKIYDIPIRKENIESVDGVMQIIRNGLTDRFLSSEDNDVSEVMQTGKAYADEKPTNPDVRVTDAEELNKFVKEETDDDILALPPDYSANPEDIERGFTIDKYADVEEPEIPEVDDEPVEEVSDEKKKIIFQAHNNLMTRNAQNPNYSPTLEQIMDEIDRMTGQKIEKKKTRVYPKEAEPFLETTVTTPVDVALRTSKRNLSQEKKKEYIELARTYLEVSMGDDFRQHPEKYADKIAKTALDLLLNDMQTMNESESEKEYPEQLGKEFKPESQAEYAKTTKAKKKHKSKKVKIKEELYDDRNTGMSFDPEGDETEQRVQTIDAANVADNVDDKEMTDTLLGYKPRNVGDNVSEDEDVFGRLGNILKPEKAPDIESELKQRNPAAWHQIQIAKKTLKMNDAMVGVMGGPSKEEAREILKKYGIKIDEEYDFPAAERSYEDTEAHRKYQEYQQKDFDTLTFDQKWEYFHLWREFKDEDDV
jgi:hypothetical protein